MLLKILLRLAIFLKVSYGFKFSVGWAGQCDPLSLSWSGGESPFQLFLIPPGGTMKNISIPASAYNESSRQGSYIVQQLELAEETSFMLSMSDATGIFAGGTSGLLTVGATRSGRSCNTTYPLPDFTYSLDTTLAQCSPYPLTLYSGPVMAILPVRFLVHIPEGLSFSVGLSTSLTWVANLTSETPVAFTVLDSENRNGGTSTLRIVQSTNDTSCLSPPATSTNTSTALQTLNTGTHHVSWSGTKVRGLAIGISIGILALVCLSLAIFWRYRKNRLRNARYRPTAFLHQHSNPTVRQVPASAPLPLVSPRKSTLLNVSEGTPMHHHLVLPRTGGSGSLGSSWPIQNQETIQCGTVHPSNTVVHADITDLAGGVMEYPPQYCEDRPPLPIAWIH